MTKCGLPVETAVPAISAAVGKLDRTSGAKVGMPIPVVTSTE